MGFPAIPPFPLAEHTRLAKSQWICSWGGLCNVEPLLRRFFGAADLYECLYYCLLKSVMTIDDSLDNTKLRKPFWRRIFFLFG